MNGHYHFSSNCLFQKIKDNVKQCLKKADTMNIHSICFPTIGTGNFKYPDFESAQEMLKGFQEFFSSPPQTITKVIIALFSGAPNTVKVNIFVSLFHLVGYLFWV